MEAVPGRAEQRHAAGEAGKEATQALWNQPKDLFANGAGVQDAAEFADLSDLGGLPAGIFKQAANSPMRRGELLLRGVALDDFLLLVELSEGQAQGECKQRCGDSHVGESATIGCFPTIGQQPNTAKHGDESDVGAEEADKVGDRRRRFEFHGGNPTDGDHSGGDLGGGPANIEPGGGGHVMMQIDPVPCRRSYGADEQKDR